jgi:hypothetical protein
MLLVAGTLVVMVLAAACGALIWIEALDADGATTRALPTATEREAKLPCGWLAVVWEPLLGPFPKPLVALMPPRAPVARTLPAPGKAFGIGWLPDMLCLATGMGGITVGRLLLRLPDTRVFFACLPAAFSMAC